MNNEQNVWGQFLGLNTSQFCSTSIGIVNVDLLMQRPFRGSIKIKYSNKIWNSLEQWFTIRICRFDEMLKGNTININLKNLINHKARCNRLKLGSRKLIVNWDLYGDVSANQVKAWNASWSIPYPWTTVWFVSRIATQLSKTRTIELYHSSVMSWSRLRFIRLCLFRSIAE